MREIKFRIFEDGVMYKNGQYGELDDMTSESIVVETGSYPFILKTTCKGDAYIERMTENSPIMQFTGFRCKKNEVYDGDIIKHPKATEPEEKGWVVVWKDFGWKLKCVNLVNGEELFTEFSNYFANDCDVIGNEFENPELLS